MFCAVWGHLFGNPKQREGEEQSGGQIGRRDAPEAEARRAHRGNFMMTGVIGQSVKQRQQKADRKHHDQQFRKANGVELCNIRGQQVRLLEVIDLVDKIDENPKAKKSHEAVSQWDQQFAQQIAIQ